MIEVKDSLKFHSTNLKIADINEADVLKHYLDLSAVCPANVKCVSIRSGRVAGTGILMFYPNEGTTYVNGEYGQPVAVAEGTRRLQYAQSVAGDDFDVFMIGYWYGGGG